MRASLLLAPHPSAPISEPAKAEARSLASLDALLASLGSVPTRKAATTTPPASEIMAMSSESIFILSRDLNIIEANERAARERGFSPSELCCIPFCDLFAPSERSAWADALARLGDRGEVSLDTLHLRKDGSTFPVSARARRSTRSGEPCLVCMADDMTTHARLAESDGMREQFLRLTRGWVSAMAECKSEQDILDAICRMAVRTGGYKMCCVALAHGDARKSLVPAASFGDESGYLLEARLSWGDNPLGQGPSGRCVREGAIQINSDFSSQEGLEPWRDAAAAHGFASSIALPLIDGGRAFGALMIYSDRRDAFGADEVSLLDNWARSVSSGIAIIHLRDAQRALADKLIASTAQTVQAMSMALELRDPYTAGHQRRVADICRALCEELGVPDHEADGIYFAATLHDIGKIQVPSELLTMPRPLTAVEFALIQVHPRAGYDILKGIDFPWPIADMVLSHHERIDGTGYPSGLFGDQIPFGARVIAVADTVESMAANRPYRFSLGLARAVAEIADGAGTRYDPKVAAALARVAARGGLDKLIVTEYSLPPAPSSPSAQPHMPAIVPMGAPALASVHVA